VGGAAPPDGVVGGAAKATLASSIDAAVKTDSAAIHFRFRDIKRPPGTVKWGDANAGLGPGKGNSLARLLRLLVLRITHATNNSDYPTELVEKTIELKNRVSGKFMDMASWREVQGERRVGSRVFLLAEKCEQTRQGTTGMDGHVVATSVALAEATEVTTTGISNHGWPRR
jgi:hypothetical protein